MTPKIEKLRDELIKKYCPEEIYGEKPNIGCGPDYAKAIVGRAMWGVCYNEVVVPLVEALVVGTIHYDRKKMIQTLADVLGEGWQKDEET